MWSKPTLQVAATCTRVGQRGDQVGVQLRGAAEEQRLGLVRGASAASDLVGLGRVLVEHAASNSLRGALRRRRRHGPGHDQARLGHGVPPPSLAAMMAGVAAAAEGAARLLQMQHARLAVDIGGTFTDLALEHGGAPGHRQGADHAGRARARRAGRASRAILREAGLRAGRRRASSCTAPRWRPTPSSSARARAPRWSRPQGFRDVLAMGNESRYDQYDLNIVLPEPLVPRYLRLPVPERLDNEGNVLLPLDEARGARAGADAAARGRARASPSASCTASSTRRTSGAARDILAEALPDVPVIAVLARSRRRCASGSGSAPRPPTPTCSR